jgi:hypothetical protein
MKRLFTFLTLAGFAGVANAHVLDGHSSIFDQLAHQLVGIHHLPVLLIIALGAWLVWRVARRDKS